MNEIIPAKAPNKDSLLKAGRSWKILSLTVIVLLSLGLAAVVFGQLGDNATLAGSIQAPSDSLLGFALLMLLTVGYLVGKSFSTGRDQNRLIEHLLEEEAIARALRLNPITQFHHPEVCRDILVREANHAARPPAPPSPLGLSLPPFL